MKTALKFLAFLALTLGASAQQGQMAANFTASSTAPFFTLNRAANTQESSIYFKTAGATTGGWRIYGSGIANQVLNFYSYQAGANVSSLSSTGLAVTGALSSTGLLSNTSTSGIRTTSNSITTLVGNDGVAAILGTTTNHGVRFWVNSSEAGAFGSDLSFSTKNNITATSVGISAFLGNNTASVLVGSLTNHSTGIIVNGTTVGTFSSTGLAVAGISTNTYSGATGNSIQNSSDTSGTTFTRFNKASGTAIGSITRVTTTDAVTYNTTSDGRLKENLRDFTDSGPIIDGLRPRLFDWKSGGTDAIGFIAQEENDVSPALARIGDNDPVCITKQWQRSDAALIPILVAELKSLRARVAELEALNTPAIP